jgi:hypothetical protein
VGSFLRSPPPYPQYLEQALMEKRLLEKLLYDKRRELEAYDKQLEEYMRLSTQRAAAGTQPLIPSGRTVYAALTGGASASAASASAAAAFAAPRASVPSAAGGGQVSQKEVLQKLLAEKKAELAAANAEVAQFSELLTARAPDAAAAPPARYVAPPPSPAYSLDASDRVRTLEALLADELRRKEEQIVLNEELLRINEEQVRTNEELVRKLLASQALAAAAAAAAAPTPAPVVSVAAAAAAVASRPPQAAEGDFMYTAGDAPPAAASAAAAAAVNEDVLVVQSDDGTQVLYRKLGRVLERPGGLGVVALGLVSSIGPAVQGAVNTVQELGASHRIARSHLCIRAFSHRAHTRVHMLTRACVRLWCRRGGVQVGDDAHQAVKRLAWRHAGNINGRHARARERASERVCRLQLVTVRTHTHHAAARQRQVRQAGPSPAVYGGPIAVECTTHNAARACASVHPRSPGLAAHTHRRYVT